MQRECEHQEELNYQTNTSNGIASGSGSGSESNVASDLKAEYMRLKKLEMLRKLMELREEGIQLTQRYGMDSDYEEMQWEYNQHVIYPKIPLYGGNPDMVRLLRCIARYRIENNLPLIFNECDNEDFLKRHLNTLMRDFGHKNDDSVTNDSIYTTSEENAKISCLESLAKKRKAKPKKGIPDTFNMSDDLDYLQRNVRYYVHDEKDALTNSDLMVQMMQQTTNGLEWINKKFDPLGLDLDGWNRKSIQRNTSKFQKIMGDIEEKYYKAPQEKKMSPYMSLLLSLGAAAIGINLEKKSAEKNKIETEVDKNKEDIV